MIFKYLIIQHFSVIGLPQKQDTIELFIINKLINLKRIGNYKYSNFGNLYDCAQNMIYFKAKSNVIEFTLNSIKLKNDVLQHPYITAYHFIQK